MIWFKCYIAWDEIVEELSDAEAGRFFKALMKYHKSGEIRLLSGTEKLMYNVALKQAKQDAEHVAEISKIRSEARRGTRKKSNESNDDNSYQMLSNDNKCEQMLSNEAQIKDIKNKDLKSEEVKSLESVNCADAQKPSKPKPEKHQHGSFKNVLLADAELEKLHERFPDADKRIESFSVKKAAKGYVYKSDYAAIIAWAGDDGKKQQQQAQAKKTYTAAEVAEMIDRGEL